MRLTSAVRAALLSSVLLLAACSDDPRESSPVGPSSPAFSAAMQN